MPAKRGSVPWNKGTGHVFEKTCLICNKIFVGRRHSKFCSPSCSGKNHKTYKEQMQCLGCGIMFQARNSRNWAACPSCSNDRSMYARIQRYGKKGFSVKAFFEERDGLCILCDKEATCLDHNHVTKNPRGALCHGCNHAISWLEKEGWLGRALEYLKRGLS